MMGGQDLKAATSIGQNRLSRRTLAPQVAPRQGPKR